MHSRSSLTLLLFVLLPEIAFAGSATVVDAMTKVRRDDPLPPLKTEIRLEAAKREFESFQIVIRGPANAVTVKATSLSGPSGATIGPARCQVAGSIRIYRERFLEIHRTNIGGPDARPPPRSDQNGFDGGWIPDALIPQVDEFDNQCRWSTTDLNTPVGQNQVLWVDILVPPTASPGLYTGKIVLAWSPGTTPSSCEGATVDVKLKVWDFELPATSNLASFFSSSTLQGLPPQHGVAARSDPLANLITRYAALGLDHRIGMTNYDDDRRTDVDNYIKFFAPLNNGRSNFTRLFNAAPRRVLFIGDKRSKASYDSWFSATSALSTQPWLASVFTYTVDEPPHNGRWCDIGPLGSIAHDSNPTLPALVTKDIKSLEDNAANPPLQQGCPSPPPPYRVHPVSPNDTADVNIISPIVDVLDGAPVQLADGGVENHNTRRAYDTFLTEVSGPNHLAINEVWTYESCNTHGCGGTIGAGATNLVNNPLWPSIGAIEHSLVRARAMPWMAYKNGVHGILYYDTLLAFSVVRDEAGNIVGGGNPWDNQYVFGGNGDGTLFYPGAPGRGVIPAAQGATEVPIASMRLKMIREGMEDYEYMVQLGSNRIPWVLGLIAGVYRNAWETDRPDINVGAELYSARHQMACRYLADIGKPDPCCSGTDCFAPGGGGGGGGGACTDPANPNLCGTTCTNFLTDEGNCGGCNVSCPSGVCRNGQCASSCNGNICCGGDMCVPLNRSCPPPGTSCR